MILVVAEFEPSLMRERMNEGHAAARAKGMRFGRKPKLIPAKVNAMLTANATGGATDEVARSFGISQTRFFEHLREKPRYRRGGNYE